MPRCYGRGRGRAGAPLHARATLDDRPRSVAGCPGRLPRHIMSDHLDTLVRNFVQGTPHMQDIGLVVTRLEKNRGSMSMPPRPQWMGDPARNLMHPGAITVLADSCCGLAVGAALDTHVTYATLDLRIDYLRPASPSLETHCDAHCYRLTRSVAFVRAEVWQEDRDEPVAAVQAAFMLSTPSGRRRATQAVALDPQVAQAHRPAAAAPGDSGAHAGEAAHPAADWQAPAASEPAMP